LAQGEWNGVAFHHFDIDDRVDENEDRVESQFREVALLIYKEVKSGGKILVHCNMGISRSSSAVLWYLKHIVMGHLSYDEILAIVREKRPVIKPNSLFNRILRKKTQCMKNDVIY
jgi:protein-tyrosine phosphatase